MCVGNNNYSVQYKRGKEKKEQETQIVKKIVRHYISMVFFSLLNFGPSTRFVSSAGAIEASGASKQQSRWLPETGHLLPPPPPFFGWAPPDFDKWTTTTRRSQLAVQEERERLTWFENSDSSSFVFVPSTAHRHIDALDGTWPYFLFDKANQERPSWFWTAAQESVSLVGSSLFLAGFCSNHLRQVSSRLVSSSHRACLSRGSP